MKPRHDKHTLKKFPHPIFAEKQKLGSEQKDYPWFFGPSVLITRDPLFQAITEIETLAQYIELDLSKMHNW